MIWARAAAAKKPSKMKDFVSGCRTACLLSVVEVLSAPAHFAPKLHHPTQSTYKRRKNGRPLLSFVRGSGAGCSKSRRKSAAKNE
jgi:hypothetical protein